MIYGNYVDYLNLQVLVNKADEGINLLFGLYYHTVSQLEISI